ncbi:Glycosyltransferase involved in cell wall bisynthesis [Desulfocicer vacuolatum DSM 3385]|uniref:Glycosyltransferase involved in cell wall bisynthesis n=1 Tax=Desulfocicer vacuolatum DSM 3385 TaxID=1121400 RepID=A0A1W1ZPM0_9BACT|nr:Glycosyltransferase involved in cell wall bisynthesis [Desulfocicer vacuolatum DSM 3385]
MEKVHGIWITWERQSRNRGIAAALAWPLVEIECGENRLQRYLKSLIRTLEVLFRERPAVVVVQNPSIVLASVSIWLSRILGFKIVIDAHNSGIYPAEGQVPLLMRISRWLQKKAHLTVVTNRALLDVVHGNRGRGFVLQDPVPLPPCFYSQRFKKKSVNGKINVLYICTFSCDEPYREVFEAAAKIDSNIIIQVTGRHGGNIPLDDKPANLQFLGFVPDEIYWERLSSADVIMDLTFRKNCLLCGAYEAVAVEKPLVLSDTAALKAYFDRGCVYVKPCADDIARGIIQAVQNRTRLHHEMKQQKQILRFDWAARQALFKRKLRALSHGMD